MVYVYGSGSVGFTRAVERLSRGNCLNQLVVFAHPPMSAIKKGSIQLLGAVTAYAPVQYAQGSHQAAVAARVAEANMRKDKDIEIVSIVPY